MKFGDKLAILRKKNGLSQEELAEKLNVSRQSVSKWESNNTYPETDKIIQICNLFDCNMDDLINDKVTDVEGALRKNKSMMNDVLDSFLDFITKSVNMFSKMSFKSGFRCVLGLAVIAFILNIFGNVFCGRAADLFSQIFKFFDSNIVYNIKSFLTSIFNVLWFILSIIIIVHTFKIRYLNNYDNSVSTDSLDDEKENVLESKKNSKIEIKNNNNTTTNNKPFAFLSVLSKILIFCFKFFVFWILLGISAFLIILLVSFVLFVSHLFVHNIFIGLSLSTLSGIVFTATLIFIGLSFIFNLKFYKKIYVILILCSLFFLGVGIGVSVLSLKGLKLVESNDDIFKLEEKTLNTKYEDNVFIEMNRNNVLYVYKVDDSMSDNDISLSTTYDVNLHELFIPTYYHNIDNMNGILLFEDFNRDFMKLYKTVVNDLSHNQIHVSYDYDNKDPLVITANSNTINKLIDNLKKIYLVKEEVVDGGSTNISIIDSKVYFPNGVHGYYNASVDELVLDDVSNYSCVRSIKETPYGDQIIYSCGWNEE